MIRESHIDVKIFETDIPLTFSDLTIFPQRRQVFYGSKEVILAPQQFNVLLYLAQQPGRVFNYQQIFEAAWSEDPENIENAVMCVIYSLRKKLRQHTDHEYICTVHGVGYKFMKEPY